MLGDEVHYFIDETDIGLGRAMAMAKAPVLHPGHQALPEVPLGTTDDDWIPVVAERGLVVITRDKLARQAEWNRQRTAGLRVIRIGARSDLNTWQTLQMVARAWDRIEHQRTTGGPGPWLAKLNGAGSLSVRDPLSAQ